MGGSQSFRSFTEFYPFYLGEHTNATCRRLHFIGTTIAAILLLATLATQHWWLIGVALAEAYASAWVGHYFFEHNKPATFKYPLFSFIGDWRMWWDVLMQRERLR